jgi:hypothetical protein
MKYFITINRIGRYYDKLFYGMISEEKKCLIESSNASQNENEDNNDILSRSSEVELRALAQSVRNRRNSQSSMSSRARSRLEVKKHKNIGTSPPKISTTRAAGHKSMEFGA